MKRKGNLYEQIISVANLELAEQNARKGKLDQYGVQRFDKDPSGNILLLHQMLKDKTYLTSAYKTFFIYEPKEREIFCLPYFPDRIVHHAVMVPLEKMFVSMFTADTYSCIKNKGIHAAVNAVSKALKDREGTEFCLKIDIKKFYPSIDHDILKYMLRKKIKDQQLLWLLDGIIDSAEGLPIGNYLSQYLANFYLSYFDHWIKESKHEKYFFRYADDIVLLSNNKAHLHQLLADITLYLQQELKLTVKGNYQIFPIAMNYKKRMRGRGLDFVGYVFYRDGHIRLRKGIKKRFARMLVYRKNDASLNSYRGWAVHANCKNLLKKLLYERI